MNLCLAIKMFEYNVSLLPVVSSRLKAPTMIFRDDSIGSTEPGNAHDMEDKLISLCFDLAKRKTMAANAYSSLQSSSGQIMSEKYIRLIDSTINKKNIYYKLVNRYEIKIYSYIGIISFHIHLLWTNCHSIWSNCCR